MRIIGVLITHGNLARAMIETTQKFADAEKDMYVFSNQKEDLAAIANEVICLCDSCPESALFVFTDLVGGSCWQTAFRIKKERQEVKIIGGVNLPMLISFAINRNNMNAEQLLHKILEDGQKAIRVIE
ncbi:MAG TPA: hypothetical protein ENJ10_02765 [Caldithrix abyssi]|uniref:PTS EIIA type-4 domain-containing protein n=1 Tax=Caldithrix abyssi TaxID=187145 RepID=A0A7V1LXW6_CALAY|nr:hypothetical protein [Caldithrix abyssi]